MLLAHSDASWNMLCLEKQLHDSWGRCCFGFKPHSHPVNGQKWVDKATHEEYDDYVQLVVEFRWLPTGVANALREQLHPEKQNKATALTEVDIDFDLETLTTTMRPMTASSPIQCQGARAFFVESGRPVETGHLVKLKVKAEHYSQTSLLIKGQWILIQMAALSGAAEVYDQLSDESPPPPKIPAPPSLNFIDDADDEAAEE